MIIVGSFVEYVDQPTFIWIVIAFNEFFENPFQERFNESFNGSFEKAREKGLRPAYDRDWITG